MPGEAWIGVPTLCREGQIEQSLHSQAVEAMGHLLTVRLLEAPSPHWPSHGPLRGPQADCGYEASCHVDDLDQSMG